MLLMLLTPYCCLFSDIVCEVAVNIVTSCCGTGSKRMWNLLIIMHCDSWCLVILTLMIVQLWLA